MSHVCMILGRLTSRYWEKGEQTALYPDLLKLKMDHLPQKPAGQSTWAQEL